MPVFEKTRFQQGAVDDEQFAKLFPASPAAYRKVFAELLG